MDFIGEYQVAPEICDKLIALHKKCDELGIVQRGRLGTDKGVVVDKKKKDSFDLGIMTVPAELYEEYKLDDYFDALRNCIEQYVEEFSAIKTAGPFNIIETPIIQYYKPGGGYKLEHFERTSWDTASRMLVWMTYLNDVTAGGGTRFTYQDKVVSARKGKTLIWPPDFTHTHAGVVSPTQKKYIITGWLNYTES